MKRYRQNDAVIFVDWDWLTETYRAFWQRPGGGIYRVNGLPGRDTEEQAQADLDKYAAANGLTEVQ